MLQTLNTNTSLSMGWENFFSYLHIPHFNLSLPPLVIWVYPLEINLLGCMHSSHVCLYVHSATLIAQASHQQFSVFLSVL